MATTFPPSEYHLFLGHNILLSIVVRLEFTYTHGHGPMTLIVIVFK